MNFFEDDDTGPIGDELDAMKPYSTRLTSRAFLRLTPISRLRDVVGKAKRLEQANRSAKADILIHDRLKLWRNNSRRNLIGKAEFKPTEKRHIGNQTRFHLRTIARFLILLTRSCKACREVTSYSIQQEQWKGVIDNAVADQDLPRKQTNRPFTALSYNENRELVQISFDVSDYNKQSQTILTTPVVRSLEKLPFCRTEADINTILVCLKSISPAFSSYDIDYQRGICQHGIYDRYSHNRVLIRPGKPPHGIYILISGSPAYQLRGRMSSSSTLLVTVIEKHRSDKTRVREITSGEIFGHHDVIFGVHRESTIVTKTVSHVFFIHKLDYRQVFNMSPDTHEAKVLNVCRHHIIFHHFPLHVLVNNPGVWSIWTYKHGGLIVKDSNDTDWLYVIKSGEARVLEKIIPEVVDVKARRKKIKTILDRESPYQQQRKLLNFISDQSQSRSVYSCKTYRPAVRNLNSAPSGTSRRRGERSATIYRSLPVTPTCYNNIDVIENLGLKRSKLSPRSHYADRFTSTNKLPYIKTPSSDESNDSGSSKLRCPSRSPSTVMFPDHGARSVTLLSVATKKPEVVNPHAILPPFVHVESLHPGDVFGFRSCLDPVDRGPSVSLVSAGCDVIQINKKFFMKHADDAVFSLIRLKAKCYPTQEELVDRLDANTLWSEYKEHVINDYVRFVKKTRR